MPRSSDYLLPGYTYHLTHRCHDRRFLLRFARDRNAYREWLRQAAMRHGVPVYGYCVTSNHVHVLVHADDTASVGRFMHLAAGATAKQHNVRKDRTGALWEHPYHCTVVEGGRHLLNCLVYISLNMVRAGVVAHPGEWRWCSHDELTGKRQRYCLLNMARLLQSLDVGSEEQLREWYEGEVEQRLAQRRLAREAHWTESLAVGSQTFVERTSLQYSHRRSLDVRPLTRSGEATAWFVRESVGAYAPLLKPESVAKG